ncbi:MAG TPA: hypothetical protein VGJ93_01125 [Desulfuromonadaceae bacterium]
MKLLLSLKDIRHCLLEGRHYRLNFLVRHQVPTILGFRFIYVMRTITPILIGASIMTKNMIW